MCGGMTTTPRDALTQATLNEDARQLVTACDPAAAAALVVPGQDPAAARYAARIGATKLPTDIGAHAAALDAMPRGYTKLTSRGCCASFHTIQFVVFVGLIVCLSVAGHCTSLGAKQCPRSSYSSLCIDDTCYAQRHVPLVVAAMLWVFGMAVSWANPSRTIVGTHELPGQAMNKLVALERAAPALNVNVATWHMSSGKNKHRVYTHQESRPVALAGFRNASGAFAIATDAQLIRVDVVQWWTLADAPTRTVVQQTVHDLVVANQERDHNISIELQMTVVGAGPEHQRVLTPAEAADRSDFSAAAPTTTAQTVVMRVRDLSWWQCSAVYWCATVVGLNWPYSMLLDTCVEFGTFKIDKAVSAVQSSAQLEVAAQAAGLVPPPPKLDPTKRTILRSPSMLAAEASAPPASAFDARNAPPPGAGAFASVGPATPTNTTMVGPVIDDGRGPVPLLPSSAPSSSSPAGGAPVVVVVKPGEQQPHSTSGHGNGDVELRFVPFNPMAAVHT